jgi:hypothetical protein
LGDFSLSIFLRYCACSSAHFTHKTLKVVTPLAFPTQGKRHARFFFQTKGSKRPKNTILKDRLKSFCAGKFSFWRRHGDDYSHDPTFWSIAMEETRRAKQLATLFYDFYLAALQSRPRTATENAPHSQSQSSEADRIDHSTQCFGQSRSSYPMIAQSKIVNPKSKIVRWFRRACWRERTG